MATSLRSVFFVARMDGEIDTQLFAAMTRVAAGQKADYITMKWKPLKPGIEDLANKNGRRKTYEKILDSFSVMCDSTDWVQ